MMHQNTPLIHLIEDKISLCEKHASLAFTNFLDEAEQATVCHYMVRRAGAEMRLYGGYTQAVRRIALFFPPWDVPPQEDDSVCQVMAHHSANPLHLLRASVSAGQRLTHRDYLGAMMALGIKRCAIGDLMVHEDGCDMVVLYSVAQYLCSQLHEVGRAHVSLCIQPLEALRPVMQSFRLHRDTVASMRLDGMIAAAFSLSRRDASQAVTSGYVSVNGLLCQKPDRPVSPGDKLTLRGRGKCQVREIASPTRKGRIPVVFARYL